MIEAYMALFPVSVLPDATQVLEFWRDAGPKLWFAKDAAFDRRFRERFLAVHEAAARGELDFWLEAADSALALVLLLDQFPRNAFRSTPRMYATDALARKHAGLAITRGYDDALETELQVFFYLPFGHSESLADQERSVALNERFGEEGQRRAIHHRDIVRRFGRFPHRNAILGRGSSTEELEYLANGGYRG